MNDLIQMGEYWIDPDLRDLLDGLCLASYDGLEKSILKNGLLSPIQYCIVKEKKIILDGHHRLKICTKHKIPIIANKIENISSKEEALDWIMEHQINRRNVGTFLKIEHALKHEKEFKKLAPKNISKTNDKLAYVLKVSSQYIKYVKKILSETELQGKNFSPILLDELRKGKKPIYEAYKEIRKIHNKDSERRVIGRQGKNFSPLNPVALFKELEESTNSGKELSKEQQFKLLKTIRILLHSDNIERFLPTQNDIVNFTIPKSDSNLIESYNLKKSLKLYNCSLKQNDKEIPISIDLLKYLQSLLTDKSIQIKINNETLNLKIESTINFNEILLSKTLIQILLDDLNHN